MKNGNGSIWFTECEQCEGNRWFYNVGWFGKLKWKCEVCGWKMWKKK